tara:strand:+ start:205 stop:582 length:378 start_codon:yes stop_codon:yes gene_type:complete
MSKPDNIIYNDSLKEYDAYKKNYPTSFNSKNFSREIIRDLKSEAQPYFVQKLNEIKSEYDDIVEKIRWNEIIFKSNYNFNPVIGQEYYLYKSSNKIFLSLIKPNEWKMQFLGTFVLQSNHTWEKI